MKSKCLRLCVLLIAGLLSATTLSADLIPFDAGTIYDDNTWHWVELHYGDVAVFALDLTTNPLNKPGTTREVRVTDAFTSGDVYDLYHVTFDGGTYTLDPTPFRSTSLVSNDPLQEVDQGSLETNVPALLAEAAWNDTTHFSSASFVLNTGSTYLIGITVSPAPTEEEPFYQRWATACYGLDLDGHLLNPRCTVPPNPTYDFGQQYDNAGVFIFVDPPNGPTAATPEPATFALIGLGLIGLSLASRRLRR